MPVPSRSSGGPLTSPCLMLPFRPLEAPFYSNPCLRPLSLTSLASRLREPLGSPRSLGLWYRGETEAPEAEAGIAATSEVRGGEEAPQPPHLEPVGSLTAPNS